MADREPILKYKGRPLFREGNTIYYGSMSDKYIVMLQILATEPADFTSQPAKSDSAPAKTVKIPQASRVMVYLQYTDPNLLPAKKIVRKTEKEKHSLFDAMDVGAAWLNRALAGKM